MRPIRLDTPRNLYANGHTLATHCPACGRWTELSSIGLARMGVLDRNITRLQFRCRQCGTRGEKQIRAPVPQAGPVHTMGY